MRSSKPWVLAACVALFLLVSVLLGLGAIETLSGDSFSSSEALTNAPNALGTFDGLLAGTGTSWRGGDTATWTVADFHQPYESISSISFAVRMSGSGWSNDNIDIQYSNDSGTTWFNAQTGVTPGALNTYGNYTVTESFLSNASLTSMRVRIIYRQNTGPDSATVNADGVEVYVTYIPPDTTPPVITLNRPLDGAFVTSQTVPFNYTATDDRGLANCSLQTNGTPDLLNQSPIVSGGFSYIDATFPADGAYLWDVACYDTSGNPGISGGSFVVKVDTTRPVVRIVSPANNSATAASFSTFVFNVSDLAPVSSCLLVVDDLVKDTISSLTKEVDHQLNATLTNGDHWWYINCTDTNGWTGQSGPRNISVQVITPTIVADKGSYEQGETVEYTGSNWQPGANVSISVTLPNGSAVTIYAPANGSGRINATQLIDYDHPTGNNLVDASQTNSSLYNASTSFTVIERPVSLATDSATYIQGEYVRVIGTGFSPGTNINLTLALPAGSVNQTDVLANATGGFNYTYRLNVTHPLGQHGLSAEDYSFSNLDANTTFSVLPRIPSVSTNGTSYVANASVGIAGLLFSELATVALQVYDTVTGFIGAGFPVYVAANATGGFTHAWNVNDTCSGNYTILASDQNETSIKANATFLVANAFNTTLHKTPSLVAGNRASPSLPVVNSSDDVRQDVGLTSSVTDGYLQFSFSDSIPRNATFTDVSFYFEHRRTGTRVGSYQVYIVRDGSLITLPTCNGAPPDADTLQSCNITGSIANASQANDLVLRINYTRTSGGPGDTAEVDFAAVNVSWTGDLIGCFEFGTVAVPPSLFSMAVLDPVVLNAGAAKAVQCNFTVSDGNGAAEILGANATIFTAPSTSGSAPDNNTRYANASCAVVSQTANSKAFSCSFAVQHYAANGTWTCDATGVSVDGTAGSSTTFTVDPLYALNVSSFTLDFGNLSTGEISRNVTENVSNAGNMDIAVGVYGYGLVPGDGNAFGCGSENITISAMRFAANDTAAYGEKVGLTSSLQTVLSVSKRVGALLQQNVSYWQVRIPDDMTTVGQCNGTIVFHAQAG